jgi:Putative prokaryotic signal transducing protein
VRAGFWKNSRMSSGNDFVRAFDATSLPLGEIAKSKLESEGIQVMIKGGSAYAYPTGPLQLWVPRDQLDRARRILRGAGEGELALSDEPDETP